MTEYNIRLNPNCAAAVHTGLKFKSGDKGIKFVIALDELDVSGATAKIVFLRSNGTSVESDITGTNGVFTYKTLGNEFAIPGKTVADIKFYATDERVSTASFIFEVSADTMDGLGAGTGGYSDRLEQLVSEAEKVEAEMKKSLQEFKEQYGEEGALNPRGDWNADATYVLRDIVYHAECMWIALSKNKGEEPSKEKTSVWMLAATGSGVSFGELEKIINGTTQVGDSKKLNGLEASEFVQTMGNAGIRFRMVYGDHNYLSTIDSSIEPVPAVANFAHIFATNSEGVIVSALSIGIDYTTNIYEYSSTSKRWEQIGKSADFANYFSVNGGTVRNHTPAPFNIDNLNAGEILSLIGYYAEGAQLGLLGFHGTNNPVFYSTAGTINLLHHDGNSAKVILDDSAPTDNTALWIDTVNKKVKAHIDGAWTVVA